MRDLLFANSNLITEVKVAEEAHLVADETLS